MAEPLEEFDDKFLTCSVCKGMYNDPRVLPCLHTFCTNCLEQWRDEWDNFTCPTCRHQVRLQGTDVSSLPASFYINSLLDFRALHNSKKARVSCGMCETGDGIEGTCGDCRFFLCKKCISLHGKVPVAKDHYIITLIDLKNPSSRSKYSRAEYCSKHKDQRMTFYCQPCAKLVCRDCTIAGHRPGTTHDPQEIGTVAQKYKDDLQTLARKTHDTVDDMKKTKETVCKELADITTNCQTVRKEVQQHFEQQRAKLERKMEKVEQELRKLEKMQKQPLVEKNKDLEEGLKCTEDGLKFCTDILARDNDVEILMHRQQLEDRLTVLAANEIQHKALQNEISFQPTECKLSLTRKYLFITEVPVESLPTAVIFRPQAGEVLGANPQIIVTSPVGQRRKLNTTITSEGVVEAAWRPQISGIHVIAAVLEEGDGAMWGGGGATVGEGWASNGEGETSDGESETSDGECGATEGEEGPTERDDGTTRGEGWTTGGEGGTTGEDGEATVGEGETSDGKGEATVGEGGATGGEGGTTGNDGVTMRGSRVSGIGPETAGGGKGTAGRPYLCFPIRVHVGYNNPVLRFGRHGSQQGQFDSPIDLVVNGERLYVADSGNQRVQVFDLSGNFCFSIPTIAYLQSVAVRADGTVVVICGEEVLTLSPTGEYLLHRFPLDEYCTGPCRLAVQREGRVVVSCQDKHTIFLFEADGTLVKQVGGEGEIVRERHSKLLPNCVCTDKDDNIVASDYVNDSVLLYDKSLNFERAFGEASKQFNFHPEPQCPDDICGPFGVSVDSMGNIVVANPDPQSWSTRLQVFRSDGTWVSTIAGISSEGGTLDWPLGVAVTEDGHVFVTDFDDHSIRKYRFM